MRYFAYFQTSMALNFLIRPNNRGNPLVDWLPGCSEEGSSRPPRFFKYRANNLTGVEWNSRREKQEPLTLVFRCLPICILALVAFCSTRAKLSPLTPRPPPTGRQNSSDNRPSQFAHTPSLGIHTLAPGLASPYLSFLLSPSHPFPPALALRPATHSPTPRGHAACPR